jgi:prepilin-type N-terminal cleavage/methylation domain-containing protein
MTSSPTNHQTSRAGFTLVELMVSVALCAIAGLILLAVLVSTMKLSSQNVVTNISSHRARQTLDRLGELVRYAQDTPVFIKSDGTTTTGTSDGILVKNTQTGPYIFRNSDGKAADDIISGSTSFMVEYAPSAGADIPKVGDFFLVNISTQPELEVATVSAATVGSSTSTVIITTKQAVAETVSPGSYTITAARYRKEAYLFVQSGTQWTLRHYPRVTSTTVYSTPANYVELGTGFQKLGTQSWFTTTTDTTGTQASWLQAVARSSNHAEYAEHISNHTTLTTMPVQVKLWNYNAPPPAAN